MASLFSTMTFEKTNLGLLLRLHFFTIQVTFFSVLSSLHLAFFLQSSIYIFVRWKADRGPALSIPLRIDRLSIIEVDSSQRPQALSPHNIVNRGTGFKPTAKWMFDSTETHRWCISKLNYITSDSRKALYPSWINLHLLVQIRGKTFSNDASTASKPRPMPLFLRGLFTKLPASASLFAMIIALSSKGHQMRPRWRNGLSSSPLDL